MRVLFTAHGAYGHVLPLVPTARALRRAGHEVRFAVADGLHPTLRSLGFPALSAGPEDSALVAEARRRWPEARREPPVKWAIRMFTDIAAPAMARDVRAVIDAWRPHLVVREEGEYGAPIAAAGAGVAWVTHGWGSPFPTAADRTRIAEMLRPHRHPVGALAPGGDEVLGAGVIDPCPPSLRSAHASAATTCSIRPEVVTLRTDDEPIVPGEGELVYVGFGTVPIYRDDPGLLTMIVRSALATGCRVVVTTPEPRIAATLRAIDRGRVDVRSWVSLPAVLSACRLVVSHGGAGTVLAALTAGVPSLLLPRGAPSQARMSAACAGRGVAQMLAQHEVSTAGVEAALVALMTDDRFRRNACGVAHEIAEMPQPSSAVPWLESAAAGRTAPRG